VFHQQDNPVVVPGRPNSPVYQHLVSCHIDILPAKIGNRNHAYLIGCGVIDIDEFRLKHFRFFRGEQTGKIIHQTLNLGTLRHLSLQ